MNGHLENLTKNFNEFHNVNAKGLQQGNITYKISKSLGFNRDFKISKEDFKFLIKISLKI